MAADMHRSTWKACRKPSENQTQLDPRGAPALRPRPRAPPLPPPGEVAAPCRRACGRRALRAARRLSRPLVCARGVLACRRRWI